jgi:hypothetical protein
MIRRERAAIAVTNKRCKASESRYITLGAKLALFTKVFQRPVVFAACSLKNSSPKLIDPTDYFCYFNRRYRITPTGFPPPWRFAGGAALSGA